MSEKRQEIRLTFKDFYTEEEKDYTLRRHEWVTSSRCPMDNTSLVHRFGDNSFEYEPEYLYCPNCDEKFYSSDKKHFVRRKQQILQNASERLTEITEEEFRLRKIIELGGKHD